MLVIISLRFYMLQVVSSDEQIRYLERKNWIKLFSAKNKKTWIFYHANQVKLKALETIFFAILAWLISTVFYKIIFIHYNKFIIL